MLERISQANLAARHPGTAIHEDDARKTEIRSGWPRADREWSGFDDDRDDHRSTAV
jgi:hypothetical protein